MAPRFTNKSKTSNKITLFKNEKLIINDQKCPDWPEFIPIPIDQNFLNDTSIFDGPIIAAVQNIKDLRVSLE